MTNAMTLSMHLAVCLGLTLGVSGCPSSEEQNANPCMGVTCSDQGVCVPKGGQPTCECFLGFRTKGLECLADPNSTAEPDASDSSGHGPSAPESGSDTSASQGQDTGSKKPGTTNAPSAADMEQMGVLLKQLTDRLSENYANCDAAKKAASEFIEKKHGRLQALSHELRVVALNVPNDGMKAEARQLMGALEGRIWQTNKMIGRFKARCAGATTAIREALGSIEICAYNPGDARILMCLNKKAW